MTWPSWHVHSGSRQREAQGDDVAIICAERMASHTDLSELDGADDEPALDFASVLHEVQREITAYQAASKKQQKNIRRADDLQHQPASPASTADAAEAEAATPRSKQPSRRGGKNKKKKSTTAAEPEAEPEPTVEHVPPPAQVAAAAASTRRDELRQALREKRQAARTGEPVEPRAAEPVGESRVEKLRLDGGVSIGDVDTAVRALFQAGLMNSLGAVRRFTAMLAGMLAGTKMEGSPETYVRLFAIFAAKVILHHEAVRHRHSALAPQPMWQRAPAALATRCRLPL